MYSIFVTDVAEMPTPEKAEVVRRLHQFARREWDRVRADTLGSEYDQPRHDAHHKRIVRSVSELAALSGAETWNSRPCGRVATDRRRGRPRGAKHIS